MYLSINQSTAVINNVKNRGSTTVAEPAFLSGEAKGGQDILEGTAKKSFLR